MFEKDDPLLETCERFARAEVEPGALRADREGDTAWARSVWERSRPAGLPGLLAPEAAGGAGLPAGVAASVVDALASRCGGIAGMFACHYTACGVLCEAGPEGHERRLERLAGSGSEAGWVGTVLLPSGGGAPTLRLREGGAGLELHGEGGIAGNAEFADACCLFAEEEGGGVTCLFLDRASGGFQTGPSPGLPGLKVNGFAPVILSRGEVAASCVVGERRKAGRLLEHARRLFFGLLAAACTGTARAAHDKARAYAGQRYQFGRIIVGHPEIQRMLGAMRMRLDVGTAAWLRIFAEPDGARRAPDPALVKAYCADAALETALDAVQIHGGYGYMHEVGVEKLLRDAKVLQLLGGSTPALQIGAVVRELEREPGLQSEGRAAR